MRTIKRTWKSEKVNMGGIILDQPLPTRSTEQIDPFLLVHHWNDTLSGGKTQKDSGVGPHPHRGFTPVTFIFQGGVHHRDSRGGDSIINAGGTQWMNAGRGIVHSERPRKDLAEEGGNFELIQFWVNAPASQKMIEPSYQPLTKEDTPWLEAPDGLSKVGLVAGELEGQKGKVLSSSPMTILRIELQKGAKRDLRLPKNFNTFIYQLDGSLKVNGKETKSKDLILFDNDDELISLEASADTRAILLSGEPLNEPLATYGPFVMNNQTQVMEAIRDYQMGKMGVLIEEFE